MTAPLLVQFKQEHHQPGLDEHVRSFFLVSSTQTHGVIRHAPFGEATPQSDMGQACTVALRELRYALTNPHTHGLEKAVMRGHNRIVDALLENDPLLDANGSRHRSLIDCVGQLAPKAARKMIEVLMKHGARVDHQAFGNDHGVHWTPLWNAVHDNNLLLAQTLIDLGATFELAYRHPEQSTDYTAAHLAASCGSAEMMMWVLDHPLGPKADGAQLVWELRDHSGFVDPQTYVPSWADGVPVPLLHLAATMACENEALAARYLDWLLENGEQWDAVDHNGETACQVAERLNGSMRGLFARKHSQLQAMALETTTPEVHNGGRRPRM